MALWLSKLTPWDETFYQLLPRVSPRGASIVRHRLAAIGSVRRDHSGAVGA